MPAILRKSDLCGPPESFSITCPWEKDSTTGWLSVPLDFPQPAEGMWARASAQGVECSEQCASTLGYVWLGPALKLVHMPGVHRGSAVGVQEGGRSAWRDRE